MAKVQISAVFYDMIHYKDKILSMFGKWDEKFADDPRGALVAGIREASDPELINLLINIQNLADGYQRIQDLVTEAEQREAAGGVEEEEKKPAEEDDDMDFEMPTS